MFAKHSKIDSVGRTRGMVQEQRRVGDRPTMTLQLHTEQERVVQDLKGIRDSLTAQLVLFNRIICNNSHCFHCNITPKGSKECFYCKEFMRRRCVALSK
ncbi:hypothetical protein HHE02_02660 [Helicobacter heilmannii]|nr:hypothetical protein [Helicobacter heilmannii]CRF46983.1 hypothetical protein HHE02_02660 [Helicobacter heilmannii]CRF49749.1 hypothetical protein HHE03_14150 [Helicobacter heilmannii]CRF51716.1 hypothetical protein HHE06_16140 [Helicobacter heilmannii]BDQ26628.1 hypothetical protein ASB1_03040 [Helicobacter heilmannii]GMB94634.1 hypothetical protein NHP21011_07270 [Helicobacter heilmannii]